MNLRCDAFLVWNMMSSLRRDINFLKRGSTHRMEMRHFSPFSCYDEHCMHIFFTAFLLSSCFKTNCILHILGAAGICLLHLTPSPCLVIFIALFNISFLNQHIVHDPFFFCAGVVLVGIWPAWKLFTAAFPQTCASFHRCSLLPGLPQLMCIHERYSFELLT